MRTGFIWDDEKNGANFRKHGVLFEEAVAAFDDPRARTVRSHIPSGEERFLITGSIGTKIITVVFTRRDDLIRIISARAARREERDEYG